MELKGRRIAHGSYFTGGCKVAWEERGISQRQRRLRKEFYLKKLREANDYRVRLGYENCYRMVFGEADGLPALIVDKYGDYLVMQCLSLGIDMRKKMICECLVELFNPKGIYERSDVSVRKKEGLNEEKALLYGEVPDYTEITENGIKMLVPAAKFWTVFATAADFL